MLWVKNLFNMLHEIFLALLGFTGGIVIEECDTFRVKEGFDLLTIAERLQTDRIVCLGWYYTRLGAFVANHQVRWTGNSSESGIQFYRTAMAHGIEDLLAAYATDIAYLEQLVLSEGSIPLSNIAHHLQKYSLVMPTLHSMCNEVISKSFWGCQLLDFLVNYKSGIPVVNEIVQRMLLRLRSVFLKQCLAWMIYGELEDPAQEFFIQLRSQPGGGRNGGSGDDAASSASPARDLRAEVLKILGASKTEANTAAEGDDGLGFDWNSTFVLRLELLPESHVSPRLASKVMFCGKAVKLLQVARSSSSAFSASAMEHRDIYRYLAEQYRGPEQSSSSSTANSRQQHQQQQSSSSRTSNDNKDSPSDSNTANGIDLDAILDHKLASSGFQRSDVERFVTKFHGILQQPSMTTELFESLVEDVNKTLSLQLWQLLRDDHGFSQFLVAVRNTYLMGKGELYQLILDGILQQTTRPPPESSRADNILSWDVVRGAAKLLGLDDDSVIATLRLRVNSPQVTLGDFNPLAAAVSLIGRARYESSADSGGSASRSAVGRKTVNRRIFLCTLPAVDPAAEFAQFWATHVLHRSDDATTYEAYDDEHRNKNEATSTAAKEATAAAAAIAARASASEAVYSQGGAWLPDQKFLAKGFSMKTTFECNWNMARTAFAPDHPLIKATAAVNAGNRSKVFSRAEDDDDASVSTLDTRSSIGFESVFASRLPTVQQMRGLLLGGLTCVIQNDRQGAQTLGFGDLGIDLPGSVSVGVSFHICQATPEEISAGSSIGTLTYLARVFIYAKGDQKARFARFGSGASVTTGLAGSTTAYADKDGAVLAEKYIQIDGCYGIYGRPLSSTSPLSLEVEYHRDLTMPTTSQNPAGSSSSYSKAAGLSATGALPQVTGLVKYAMRARLSQAFTPVDSSKWDIEATVDISNHVKLYGGQAYIGCIGSGIESSSSSKPRPLDEDIGKMGFGGGNADKTQLLHEKAKATVFGIDLHSMEFSSKGALATYPVASPFTSSRFPETYMRLEKELSQFRAWMVLKMQFRFPPLFKIIFDAEALGSYERIFTALMKVRLVSHALERLWMVRSRLASDRSYCQLRHSMHFFISNLLYHLQVDVLDSEFCALQQEVSGSTEFQTVLRAHRNFVSSIVRLSYIDNLTVQEGIERILQVCLRFVAVSRLLHQQEDDDVSIGWSAKVFQSSSSAGAGAAEKVSVRDLPVVVPPEEMEAIRKEFFTQISYLFQIMRKIESRGFMFRLDFNGYLSSLVQDMGGLP